MDFGKLFSKLIAIVASGYAFVISKTRWIPAKLKELESFFVAISAVAAFGTILLSVGAWTQQIEAGRPYLVITDVIAGSHDNLLDGFYFGYYLENYGLRPAKSVSSVFFQFDSAYALVDNGTLSMANDLSPKLKTDVQTTMVLSTKSICYILVIERYVDSVTSKSYDQKFYFSWDNSRGKTMVHATPVEAAKMDAALKAQNMGMSQ